MGGPYNGGYSKGYSGTAPFGMPIAPEADTPNWDHPDEPWNVTEDAVDRRKRIFDWPKRKKNDKD